MSKVLSRLKSTWGKVRNKIYLLLFRSIELYFTSRIGQGVLDTGKLARACVHGRFAIYYYWSINWIVGNMVVWLWQVASATAKLMLLSGLEEWMILDFIAMQST